MLNIPRMIELMEKGETFCLSTIIDSDSSDFVVGQKIIVLKDGSVEGEISSPLSKSKLGMLAIETITTNKKRVVEIEDKVKVFFDVLSDEPKLIICGAGHIALPLARFAREVGFRIKVIDDRSDFANMTRFPGCEVIVENFIVALQGLSLGPSTYVVVITRGHEHDADCLLEILQKETAYVGLIGSRRRVRIVLKMLRREGISKERLNEVFTPIGLPIGAESPEEIALSIVSELVCVRRKGSAQALSLRMNLLVAS